MDNGHPSELIELQGKIEEIFWFVKRQAQLAKGNISESSKLPIGDLDETERGVHKRIMELGQRLIGEYFRELGSGDVGYRVTYT